MSDDKLPIRTDRKRLAAKLAYIKSKAEREHALLRLRPGSLARIDQARAVLRMTRSAYIEFLLDAASPSNAACAAGPVSTSATTSSIGDEFEALFGGG
jgi:hypothetical protein